MIKELREKFNNNFHERSYHELLRRMNDRFRTDIRFRVAETPVFLPNSFRVECEKAAVELALQSHKTDYLRLSQQTIPQKYNTANQTEHSHFITVDFAITEENGKKSPKLIELQGFPSLMAYQLAFSELMMEHYSIDPAMQYTNGNLSRAEYINILKKLIVKDEHPESVVLLELDPFNQKTLPDFLMMRELLGIGIADVRYIKKEGKELFYEAHGELHPIRRIFNRVIFDELEQKNIRINFEWGEELDIEWVGHPNWFYHISKFTLPYLQHSTVPTTFVLGEKDIPTDLNNYVLKPLFSFAGRGVIISPTITDINSIPKAEQKNFVLQQRVEYANVIDTPVGATKCEYRVMLVWLNGEPAPIPIISLARLGRGSMMGVDHNANMQWIGSSCTFYA